MENLGFQVLFKREPQVHPKKHKIIALKNREKLKSFIDRNNLTDVWRTLNPEFNFRILKIGKPRPERVLIFPDRQTSGSAGVNFRHC